MTGSSSQGSVSGRKMSTFTIAPTARDLSGKEKLDDINRILDILEVDLEKTNILPPKRNELLEQLKAHTRTADDAAPLFTERGVKILCRQSFDSASPTTSRIALRCLGNVMYHDEKARQRFVDLGFAPEAAERMKDDNREDELLASRLLFLCTYGTSLDFEPLFTEYHIAETINTNLGRHVKTFAKTKGQSSPPLADVLAVTETLKLLYNLTNFYPHRVPDFTKSLLPIVKILSNVKIPSPPLQPPKCNIERLTHILDLSLKVYSDEEADQFASPLVQVLLRVSEFAPPAAKAHLRLRLLPSDAERDRALGKGDSLAARLLRLTAAPLAPHLRQFIPALLFELSDKDAARFVRNVGYGFAAGFLMSHDVAVPASALEAWSTGGEAGDGSRIEELSDEEGEEAVMPMNDAEKAAEAEKLAAGASGTMQQQKINKNKDSISEKTESVVGTESGAALGSEKPAPATTDAAAAPKKKLSIREINPITGQRRDMEPEIDMPEMTDEEKLREAERLFVLFERLRATGVVDIENPVAKAAREGNL